jgi:hypothetical protein
VVKSDLVNDEVVDSSVPVVQFPALHSYPVIVPSVSAPTPVKETLCAVVIELVASVGTLIVAVGILFTGGGDIT